jgi:hypothetical protein
MKRINYFNRPFLLTILFINIVVNSFLSAKFNILNSDSVWGNILLPEMFRGKIYLNLDTFLFHYPFTYVASLFFGIGNMAVFLNIFALVLATLITYSVFYIYFVYRYLDKQKLIYFLPLLFFINISWGFYRYIAHPFYRNIEFGVALLLVIYFDRLKKIHKNLALAIFIYLLLLLLLISDPYFLYLFAIPLFMVLVIKSNQEKWYATAAKRVIFSIIGYFIVLLFLNFLPYFFIFPRNPALSTISGIISNVTLFTHGAFFLLSLQSRLNIFSVIEFGLFFVGIYGLYLLLKERYKEHAIIPILLPLCFCFTIFANIFSTAEGGRFDIYRYLLFLLFILPLGLCFFLSKINSTFFKKAFVSVLLVLSVINFITITITFYQAGINEPYKQNYSIVHAISKYGVNNGYTSYWNAAINTYTSDNNIKFRQVLCSNHHIYPFFWVSALRWYEVNREITKNFILIDFAGNLTPELKGCTFYDIVRQFGKPDKIVRISTNKGAFSLLLFNRNIANKF